MGILGNQRSRDSFQTDLSDVDRLVRELVNIAERYDVSLECVLDAKELLERERQNNLAVQNGDFFDEQMGGFGERVSALTAAISEIAAAIRDQ
jgi:cell division GTPase FtsZ